MKNSNHYTKLLPLLMLLLASCVNKKPDNKSGSNANIQALPVDARVIREQTHPQMETAVGSLLPNRSVRIVSELSRKVSRVLFKDGSNVRQGQPLFQLDDADIRAKIREAQAELTLAETTERRLQELLKTDAVRQEEYDVALSKKLALTARLDQLRIEQSKTVIRAPFEGTIGISKVFAGALVGPGIEMVDIHQQSQLKVSFSAPEKYITALRTGRKITYFTSLTSDTLQATVMSVDAAIDAESRSFTVQAITTNTKGLLRAGMSVKVLFSAGNNTDPGLAVPSESLIPGNSGFSVFVIRNGKAKISPIEVTDRNEREAIVTAGIAKGDTVLTSNIMRAADGVPVSIVKIN